MVEVTDTVLRDPQVPRRPAAAHGYGRAVPVPQRKFVPLPAGEVRGCNDRSIDKSLQRHADPGTFSSRTIRYTGPCRTPFPGSIEPAHAPAGRPSAVSGNPEPLYPPAFLRNLARTGTILVGPVIDVERLLLRLGVGTVAGCTGHLVPGMMGLVRPGMVRRVVPGILKIVLPVLAHPGRTALRGILFRTIGTRPWCHVQYSGSGPIKR